MRRSAPPPIPIIKPFALRTGSLVEAPSTIVAVVSDVDDSHHIMYLHERKRWKGQRKGTDRQDYIGTMRISREQAFNGVRKTINDPLHVFSQFRHSRDGLDGSDIRSLLHGFLQNNYFRY